ncbi:hypothetical protein [Streptomyces adelaidensis]|nr:hypothetical protein [Streptomyces adelaidensis]
MCEYAPQYQVISLEELKSYTYKNVDEVVWAAAEVGSDFPENRRGRRR